MSSNKEAQRHRRHNDRKTIRKYTELSIQIHGYVHREPGRYRKVNPFTCGRGRCQLCCNPRRIRGALTLAEQKANASFKYALLE